MVNTPEGDNGAQGSESLADKVKTKAKELVNAVKSKFEQKEHPVIEEYFKESPSTDNEIIKAREATEKAQKLKILNNVVVSKKNSAEVLQSIQTSVEAVCEEVAPVDPEYAEEYTQTSEKLTQTTMLPFARYTVALAENRVMHMKTGENLVKKVELFNDIFVQEAKLGQQDLEPIYALIINDLERNMALLNQADIARLQTIIRRLSLGKSVDVKKLQKIVAETIRLNPEWRQRSANAERKGDAEGRTFIQHYKELEEMVNQLEVSPEKKKGNTLRHFRTRYK